jgi:hypothetical protein
MKKILLIMLLAIVAGCETPGTLERLSEGENSDIEVYRYYYSKTEWVYVARFKDQHNINTVNWKDTQRKNPRMQANVVIFENDSIQVIRKR